MFERRILGFLSAAALATVAACSGASGPERNAAVGEVDEAGSTMKDGGGFGDAQPDGPAFTPAAHPPQMILPNQGGPTLLDPEIVTVTWPGETLASELAAFDDWIGKSSYWTIIASDYGVRAATHPASWVAPAAAPLTLDDADIQKVLLDGIAAKTLRAPTPNTIYTVYPPAGTAVTSFGATGCVEFQAYHYATTTPDGTAVVYAVTPRCAFTQKLTPLDFTTWGSSHEIVEAATDPFYDRPAYRQDDPTKGQLGENADLCTGFPLRIEGHTVTANWSIKAAKADERPCVPAAPGPMFGLAPASTAITIAKGASQDVAVTAYSNAPMGAFSIFAYAETEGVTARLSAQNGTNGDALVLQVTAPASAPSGLVSLYLYAETPDYHTTSSLTVRVK
jgi:hypothetical protein